MAKKSDWKDTAEKELSLEKWPDFVKYVQQLKGHNIPHSSSAAADGAISEHDSFSLILKFIQPKKESLYRKCGFAEKHWMDLDQLIHKVEQFTLMEIVKLYRSFDTMSFVDHMASCTVNLKRLEDEKANETPVLKVQKTAKPAASETNNKQKAPKPAASETNNKQKTPKPAASETNNKQKTAKPAASETNNKLKAPKPAASETNNKQKTPKPPASETNNKQRPPRTSGTLDLGRGKRQKFAKVKFEFEDESATKSMPQTPTPIQNRAKETPKKSPVSQTSSKTPRVSLKPTSSKKSLDKISPDQKQKLDSGRKRKADSAPSETGSIKKKKVELNLPKPVSKESEAGAVNKELNDDGEKKLETVDPGPSIKFNIASTSQGETSIGEDGISNIIEPGCPAMVLVTSPGAVDLEMQVKPKSDQQQAEGLKDQEVLADLGQGVAVTKEHVDEMSITVEGQKDYGSKLGETPEHVGDQRGMNVKAENGLDEVDHVKPDGEETAKDKIADGDMKGVTNEGAELTVATKAEGDTNTKSGTKVRRGRGPQKATRRFPWNLVPIICSICKVRYSTYTTLRRHYSKQHLDNKEFDQNNPPKLLLCEICEESFSEPRPFLQHYRVHAVELNLNVSEKPPKAKFTVSGERTDFDCDKKVPITCSVCKQTMVGDGAIYSHWKSKHRSHPDEKPPPLFYCDQCEQTFDAPRKFKIHYRQHTGAKPHECEICKKTFRTHTDVVAHMACHSKERPYICEICKKGFIAQKVLNRHMKGHLSPVVCDICGKSYPTKYSLKLHMKIHTGEKPYKCEFCGVSFIQSGSLKLHRRLHLGEKPHVCETCGLRFNSLSHLKTHRRVHTGEKPFKCNQCSYAAASSSRLKDHLTVHRDEKPHVCKVPGCGRRYKRLSHLIFHHGKHSGISPYVCNRCGQSFKLSSALTFHKRQDACLLRMEEAKQEVFDIEWVKDEEKAVEEGDAVKEDTESIAYIYTEGEEPEFKAETLVAEQQQNIQVLNADGTQVAIASGGLEQEEGGEFAQQIVIQILREPGQEDEDIVLSKEELERIVRLSQQM